MEQHMQYMMRLKSKQIFKSHFQAPMNYTVNNSWEEQAFAEDAAGPLGGFVWPPRSYSCTFCTREFRSAQALGGHMNVHRRDRARLKQSLGPQTEFQFENCSETPSTLPGNQHSAKGGDSGTSSLFSSASRASAAIFSQENSSVQAYVSPFSSIANSKTISNGKYVSKEVVILDNEDSAVETNLSVGINFGSDNEEIISSKRRKSNTTISSLPSFHKPCSSNRYIFPSEVLRIKASSIEDIDLELRLGDPPAVK